MSLCAQLSYSELGKSVYKALEKLVEHLKARVCVCVCFDRQDQLTRFFRALTISRVLNNSFKYRLIKIIFTHK